MVRRDSARYLYEWAERGSTHLRNTLIGEAILRVIVIFGRFVYAQTLFLTSRLFGKAPVAPTLKILDVRCNRVKVAFIPSRRWMFNVDEYQLMWRESQITLKGDAAAHGVWQKDVWTKFEYHVVAPLKSDATFEIRVRCRNIKGQSGWGPVLPIRTLLRPEDGGSTCSSYAWSQNGKEVTIEAQIPKTIKSRDLRIKLRPSHLYAAMTLDGDQVTLLDEDLYGRVRLLSPDGGSYWELERGAHSTLRLVLEKEKAATSIKWGFWRSAFLGHPEIDTHCIQYDPNVATSGELGSCGLGMSKMSTQELDTLRKGAGGVCGADLEKLPESLKAVYSQ